MFHRCGGRDTKRQTAECVDWLETVTRRNVIVVWLLTKVVDHWSPVMAAVQWPSLLMNSAASSSSAPNVSTRSSMLLQASCTTQSASVQPCFNLRSHSAWSRHRPVMMTDSQCVRAREVLDQALAFLLRQPEQVQQAKNLGGGFNAVSMRNSPGSRLSC